MFLNSYKIYKNGLYYFRTRIILKNVQFFLKYYNLYLCRRKFLLKVDKSIAVVAVVVEPHSYYAHCFVPLWKDMHRRILTSVSSLFASIFRSARKIRKFCTKHFIRHNVFQHFRRVAKRFSKNNIINARKGYHKHSDRNGPKRKLPPRERPSNLPQVEPNSI